MNLSAEAVRPRHSTTGRVAWVTAQQAGGPMAKGMPTVPGLGLLGPGLAAGVESAAGREHWRRGTVLSVVSRAKCRSWKRVV